MNRWEHDIKHLTRDEIMNAIRCDEWQLFRIKLKGQSTQAKLIRCEWWLKYGCGTCGEVVRQRQIDNYLNALKRGGQLDLEGNVVR